MVKRVLAALQVGSEKTTKETLDKILSYEQELKQANVDLVVIPEATLGGYPKGSTFGSHLGYRLPSGREEFLTYFKQSITVPGPETQLLETFSAKINATIAIGVIENGGGSTMYCSIVYIDPKRGYVGKHRKLMPTASERLVWGQGDGSTIPVIESAVGRIGGAICWENYMPLLRQCYYSKGIDVWVAPTVDMREIWRCSMRTIAYEGRNFLVSAVQFQPAVANEEDTPTGWEMGANLINGGSVIIDPMGEIVAGPLIGKEGVLTAEIETDDVIRARFDLDPAGHYFRGDVFKLTVDETSRDVEFVNKKAE
ncbi:NIT1 [Candida margitis]|uniref:NIT1 n=1 Tax=Candida margitis TaxID=1775924 RepID=UPI002225CEC4|nr:NIT1 [Candida margitis]KAI5967917.1 NIT1 [Candida margitis]